MTNAVRKGEVAVSETSSRRWHAHLRILPHNDASREMVAQARARNAIAVKIGRVELLHGTVDDLPFAGDPRASARPTWQITGPLVLFLGLLSLLNAPFDWASLGLTRALLRRGLELGGWWPYALALVDAGLAAVVCRGPRAHHGGRGPGF